MMHEDRLTACRLVHDPRDRLIPWQIHTLEPWVDSITRQPTSYLAGFPTEAARAEWVRIAGYRPLEEAGPC